MCASSTSADQVENNKRKFLSPAPARGAGAGGRAWSLFAGWRRERTLLLIQHVPFDEQAVVGALADANQVASLHIQDLALRDPGRRRARGGGGWGRRGGDWGRVGRRGAPQKGRAGGGPRQMVAIERLLWSGRCLPRWFIL